jgi:predicted RNase H-like HicB family nuclease
MKKKLKINIAADRVKEKSIQYLTFEPKGQYAAIIEQDEDGFFTASVPALPGCHTQAKTLIELRKQIKDAIKLCLEVAKKDPEYQNKIQQFAYNPSFIGMEMFTI